MKSFNKEFAKYTGRTRLTASERRELRERILTYMEYHPLPKSEHGISESISAKTRSFSRAQTIFARIAVGAFAFLFVIVSVPIAAERSKPGDVLYPVKTRINESIQAQFIDSPYEKVVFETELMDRRIAEARLLAKEGKLTEEQEAQIAESVKNQAGAVQRSISDLRASDADEAALAAITFKSSLEVQSALFGDAVDTDDIANAVREAKVTADAESGTTTPSYNSLAARVEESTTRVFEFFASVESAATAEEEEKIERRLSDIQRTIEAAHKAHDDGEDVEAVALLSGALGDIQKLISFMTDIDVRENVSLDTLVPIILTPEERLALVADEFYTIESEWGTATTTDSDVSDDPIAVPEIVTIILDDVPALMQTASSSLAGGDTESADVAIDLAIALIVEFKLIESEKSEDPPVEEEGAEAGVNESETSASSF